MAPPDGNTYVHCPECGSKASADWSFCRSCNASLADAEPVGDLVVRDDGEDVDLSAFLGEVTGCAKCGHTEATVDDIAVTSNDTARALDVESRRFRSVTCARCGYTEQYKGRRPKAALALFLR